VRLRPLLLVLLPLVVGPLLGAVPGAGQERPIRWKRRQEATRPRPTVFHATMALTLPTAETLGKGEILFEVSHRFLPAASGGWDVLFGLDGPARNRLALSFAPHDRVLLTLGRSNRLDNVEFQVKARVLESDRGGLPLVAAVQSGAAWSTEVPKRRAGDAGNFQYYGLLVLNAALAPRLSVGLVPAYLYNPDVELAERAHAFSIGAYGHLRLSEVVGLLAEWNGSRARPGSEYDAVAAGIELETGGHFFRILFSNSTRLNPSQYLAGAEQPFRPGEWRLGFTITRLLKP